MASATRTRGPSFVDVGSPAMAIDCPRCGLVTPRFLTYCQSCGFSLWPTNTFASAAFRTWQAADPARAEARPFDLELPVAGEVPVIDYEARAHRLGIHIFPSSNFPFVICIGFLLLALAAIPLATPLRIGLAAAGLLAFLTGVVGWVVLEDVRMFPGPEVTSGQAQHRAVEPAAGAGDREAG